MNLKYTMEKHKNDNVPTFGTNISLMCKDILNYLEKDHCEKCPVKHELEVNLKKWENAYRRGLEDGKREAIEQEPRCKKCKWWKDSDGKFIRGVGTESKCPINHKEVYEGNGYCFLYKPKKSEDNE